MTEIKEIAEKLIKLPDEIHAETLKLLDVEQAISDQSILVDKLKAKHWEGIVTNPTYKNSEQRQSALDKLLEADVQYSDAKKILDNTRRRQRIIQANLEHLKNQFSAWKAIAGMLRGD